MALIDVKFYSEALGMQTEAYVVLPQRDTMGEIGIAQNASDKKYPVLYLLHGLSDDHSIWLRRTSIERYATEYGICVVMPCGHRSFYMDMKYGLKYFTYIAKELPARMCEFFPISDKREDTYICGNSMGGYGALKIALRQSDRFSAAAGLSSAADIHRDGFHDVKIAAFGPEEIIPPEEDLFYLAKENKNKPQKPRIFMGVGYDDFLYEENLRLKKCFEETGYDFTYRESEGSHNWAFWDEYVQYVLAWIFQK